MSQELTTNVYKKLQAVRVALQTLPMTKSGHNKFAGYKYLELSDFMPNINRLFGGAGLCSVVSFTADEASLTIINAENPLEQITFFSPMSTAQLKGCHEVQNLGAVQTYLRRYLYMLALEIVDQDPLDAKTGEPGNGGPRKDSPPAPEALPKQTGETRCPSCGKSGSIIKSKNEYGGGWVCFIKKKGCGAKFTTDPALAVAEFATQMHMDEIEHLAPLAGVGILKILERYKKGTLSMLTKAEANEAVDKLAAMVEAKKPPEQKDIPL